VIVDHEVIKNSCFKGFQWLGAGFAVNTNDTADVIRKRSDDNIRDKENSLDIFDKALELKRKRAPPKKRLLLPTIQQNIDSSMFVP
jgi:hypothetical protein